MRTVELDALTIVSRGDVAQAAVQALQDMIGPYLSLVERERGIAPNTTPRPNSDAIFQGLDFEYLPDASDGDPLVIVTCQPSGNPQRLGNGQYTGWFELEVGAVVAGGDEEEALDLADLYGAATMGLILSEGGNLGGFAQETVMTEQPRAEFPDPALRRRVRSVGVYRTLISRVVSDIDLQPISNGTRPGYADAETYHFDLQTVPVTTPVSN